tara:strand:- start:225 stop:530 length:306 start_codon:yes stop_codon:yes gene_type:complete
MIFTREQFDELGKFYVNDFPINDSNQDTMFELFNSLDEYLQGMAIQHGLSDSVFRDDVFECLCSKLLNMSCEEYYESDVYKDYFDNGVTIEIDFSILKGWI